MYSQEFESIKKIPMSEAKVRLGEITRHFQENPDLPILLTWYNKPFLIVLSADSYFASMGDYGREE